MLLLAHYDVVPVEAEKWSADPFGAEIREESEVQYVYGRGALDMKSMLIAILESAEELCEKGFAPKRIYGLPSAATMKGPELPGRKKRPGSSRKRAAVSRGYSTKVPRSQKIS